MDPTTTAAPPGAGDASPLASVQPSPPDGLSASPPDLEPPRGSRADLFRSKKKARTKWIRVPANAELEREEAQYLVAALKPGQMAWVSNACFVRRPDPDDPEKETTVWDSTKRGFFMLAIALCEPDGKRMYPGSIEDPSQWIYGAEKAMDLDLDEYDALFSGINDFSGFNKKALDAAGKGSGKTPSTG